MGWYDLLEMIFASAAGQIYGLVRGLAEFIVYVVQLLWIVIVRAFLAIIEWADERWYDLQIADNALLRMAVTGIVGFVLAVPIVLFIARALGHPELACWFALIVAFCVFVGLMADPGKDWSLPKFPGSGGKKGPDIPLNL